jgi:hypothetical protein
MLKLRMGQIPSSGYSVGGGERGGGGGSGVRSWRMYSGHSDNDLPPQRHSVTRGSSSGGHYSSKGSGMSRTSRSLSGAGPDGGKVLLSPDREGRDRSGAERGGGGGSGSGGAGGGDSDVESLVSFVSGTSALSTQSERPSAYVKRVGYVTTTHRVIIKIIVAAKPH